jgi:hypothetical protein
VVSDEWADWPAGTLIPNAVTNAANATFGPDTSSFNLFVYPSTDCPIYPATNPVAKVRTSTGVVVIQNQSYGGYTCYGSFYRNMAMTTIETSNLFFTCTGRLVIRVRHHTPGSFASNGGEGTIVLQKVP